MSAMVISGRQVSGGGGKCPAFIPFIRRVLAGTGCSRRLIITGRKAGICRHGGDFADQWTVTECKPN